jgi:hypothetical protein
MHEAEIQSYISFTSPHSHQVCLDTYHSDIQFLKSFIENIYPGFFLGLHFKPEDRSDMFLQNIGWLSPDYTVLYSGRQNTS